MLSARFKPWHVPLFLGKYAWLTARRRPVLVHFEVTLRCNARCGFCDYWKTDPPSARADELQELRRRGALLQSDARHVHRRRADAAPRSRGARRRRRSRDRAQVRHAHHARRDAHAERARRCGTPASISSTSRSTISTSGTTRRAAFPGSRRRSSRAIPAMRARGIDNIRFNTVIKNDNLDQIAADRRARARSSAVGVNFSVYTDAKNGNRALPRRRAATRRARRRRASSCSTSSGGGAASSRTPTTISSRFRGTCAARCASPVARAFARFTSIPRAA